MDSPAETGNDGSYTRSGQRYSVLNVRTTKSTFDFIKGSANAFRTAHERENRRANRTETTDDLDDVWSEDELELDG